MALISLTGATFDYGRERILHQVDLTVQPGLKYALVGPNGAGKSTLLAALAGELTLQAGTRQAAGRLTVRLLRQDTGLDPGLSSASLQAAVLETAFARELELEDELERLARALAGDVDPAARDEMVARQGRAQLEFERLGGYTMRARLEAALRGVGLPPALWDLPLERLSGGERRRAALAAALLGHADLLLLDEPTNHLDLGGCEWLEAFLADFPGAAVLVSHDRYFLDRTARRTWHLEGGRLDEYPGNYSVYEEERRQRRRRELAAYENQQDRIRKLDEYVRRNIASGGTRTKQAQSRRKQLARELERPVERPVAEPRTFRFGLEPVRQSGGMVLEAHELGFRYGARPLLSGLDLVVSRGDRIGIIGPNGCGKSTLLQILAGRLVPSAGTVKRGHNVDLGLYDQELQSVSSHRTVLEEIATVDPTATVGELRTFLGAFAFDEDRIDRLVGDLSGGERGRLALLRLIKEGHNTLLLDEPTNHLDVRSREALEEALAGYEGTLVVVSHDRRFLDRVAERILAFLPEEGEGVVRQYLGSYADFLRRRHREREEDAAAAAAPRRDDSPAAAPERPDPGDGAPLSKNERARRRAWIAEAESRIADLEDERAELLAALGDPGLDAAGRVEAGRRCAELDGRIAAELARWETWHAELEGEAGES